MAAEKKREKQAIDNAIEQLRLAAQERLREKYEQDVERIRERHAVRITPGSSLETALKEYERRERVARDIRKDVIKKAREEVGKEEGGQG